MVTASGFHTSLDWRGVAFPTEKFPVQKERAGGKKQKELQYGKYINETVT